MSTFISWYRRGQGERFAKNVHFERLKFRQGYKQKIPAIIATLKMINGNITKKIDI